MVYYLHGMGDNESTHLVNVRVLDEAIRKGQVPPMIYVYTNTGRTSWFSDSADGKVPGESLVVKELIPHVDQTYRTIASREGRGLQGFSMGGFGAMKLGLKYPELFSSVVAHSGAYLDWQGLEGNERGLAMLKGVLGNDKAVLEANTPFALARSRADQVRGKVAFRLDCGTKDRLLECNRAPDKLLGELKIPHEYAEVPEMGHDPRGMYGKIGVQGFQFNAAHFGARP